MAIIGRRGSGKSVFIREVIWNNMDRCVCHDRKFEHSFEGVPTAHTTPEMQALWAQGYNKIVYQPYDSSYEDFDTFCEAIFYHANTGVWIDESASVTTSAICPHWFGEVMRLGRIRGIGCYCATQRPMMVSNLIFSEAELVVSFKLNLYNDALKVAQIAGERIVPIVMGLGPYEFIISDGNEIQTCTPLALGDEGNGNGYEEVQTNEGTEDELAPQGPGAPIGDAYQ